MGDHILISDLKPEMAPTSINVVGVVISADRDLEHLQLNLVNIYFLRTRG